MFIDPVGRVYDATRLFRPDVRVSRVYTTDVTTFYTRYGDLVGNGSAAAALLLVAAAWHLGRRRRRSRRPGSLDPAGVHH
jgi:apolipoprotein N-acyltransferase